MTIQPSFPTALGPNDPDDGDAGRRQRGMAIAVLAPISKDHIGYRVPSQSSKHSYVVILNGKGGRDACSCPDYEERQRYCKHLYAVQYIIQREELADGSVAKLGPYGRPTNGTGQHTIRPKATRGSIPLPSSGHSATPYPNRHSADLDAHACRSPICYLRSWSRSTAPCPHGGSCRTSGPPMPTES